MLNDIERRRFLIQPARKHLAPFVVGPTHDQLDKAARQLLAFPRLGLVTGFKADNRVADPHRLPWFHLKVARQTIAFIEKSDRRNALGHRRPRPRCRVARRRWLIRLGRNRFLTRCRQRTLNCGCCGRQAEEGNRATDQPATRHDASGLHAS
jgi:hypothetical protein